MFAYLTGKVTRLEADRLVLDVGGVGYELFASGNTLRALSKEQHTSLHVHMHIAEGVLALYGFVEIEEKNLFRRLISVSRVGPKVAIGAFGVLKPAEIAVAIASGDEKALAKIPGMGKKTAQRVILELQEKLQADGVSPEDLQIADESPVLSNIKQEAVSALIALGYDSGTASHAVAVVKNEHERVELLITEALKNLA